MSTVIFRLKTVHARLDAELRRELRQRWPDQGRLARLKKLKLAIKDRIHWAASRKAVRAG